MAIEINYQYYLPEVLDFCLLVCSRWQHTLAEQANLHAFASVCIYKQAICHSKQYGFSVLLCTKAERKKFFPHRIADLGAVLKIVLSSEDTQMCLYLEQSFENDVFVKRTLNKVFPK